ncbi:MAG: FAD-binding domain-containing protein, partial [Candidatus Promineifilaceae bacterium]|nr:FAD-binding domain-containing protein [Candidatus Promineifilaceae bacterium]
SPISATNGDLRRDFSHRDGLLTYVKAQFPQAAAVDDHVAETRGGRRAALETLTAFDPHPYAKSRNYLDGAVSRLSPYLRHGVLNPAEVRDAVLAKVDDPKQITKFINELGWRDYYQRVYQVIGQGIWADREHYKTGFAAEQYGQTLPEEIPEAATGLACIDAFSRQLHRSGYLHNHARMYLAAYIVHWRRVRWQAGARWFLTHLLDGDPASNNLSWQWVASTFSHKPYFFNRENLEKYTRGAYCNDCPLYGHCPFEGSYPTLEKRLFPDKPNVAGGQSAPAPQSESQPVAPTPPDEQPVVWVHGDALSPVNSALRAYPDAPAVFVWDDPLLEAWRISLKRLVFLYECLLELPVTIRRGLMTAELTRFADRHGTRTIVTSPSPSPRFAAIGRKLAEEGYTVIVYPDTPLVSEPPRLDLKRFSRYWRKVQDRAMQPSGRNPLAKERAT